MNIMRANRRILVCLFVLVTFCSPAFGQAPSTPVTADEEVLAAIRFLESRLDVERQQRRIPGLSAAVVYDQDIVWSKGFGYADVPKKLPATPQTIYRVASITKLFTATMLMQLRDARKVGLEEPVTKYVPELKLSSRHEDSPPITLGQLASHVSGFPRAAPMDYWRTLKFPPIEKMVEALTKDGERIFPPNKEWKYSNVGFGVLGFALSRAAGRSYFAYVEENILRPLGMKSSGFAPSPGLATGYALPDPGKEPEAVSQPDYGGYGPATSLYTNVEDISRFISLQFRDGPAGGSQILRGSSLREMHAAHWVAPDWQSGWGIGFRITRVGSYTAIGHGGGIQGFRTDISLIPSLKLGVAVFTNTNSDPEQLTNIALEMLAPVIDRAQQRRKPEPPPAPAAWNRYVGKYATDFGSTLQIRIYKNRLQLVPSDDPAATPVALTPLAEHRFRMKGGSASGEVLWFEVDAQGKANVVWMGPYPAKRVSED